MKGIDIKLLHAFVTLVKTGSYINAAKILFLTQPALSKRIQSLEMLVNGHLFLRGRHGAILTEFGTRLLPKANDLLQAHTDFLHFVKELNKENDEKLYLGFGISSFHNVPLWIKRFHHLYPRCDVIINQLPSSVQMKMLMKGELHVGFVRMPVPECLSFHVINEEVLVLAIPSNNRIEPANTQNLLSSYMLLQLDISSNPCLAEHTDFFLKNNKLNAKPFSVTDDMSTLLALIAGGNGIAFLPASVRHFMPAGVKLLIPSEKQVRWDICVAWNPVIKNQRRDDFMKIVTAEEISMNF